jgi:hypothetical protein
VAKKIRAIYAPVPYVIGISGVKIGNIFRQFSTKSTDTCEQKSNFPKIFNLLSQNELRTTSDKKRLYFRIKSAATSNYRGSVFLLAEFTPSVCSLAFLPGAKSAQLFTCL